jgi:hypothetical protein
MTGARLVHDTLEAEGWEIEIADAQKVNGLAPLALKTDRIDSKVLAVQRRSAPSDHGALHFLIPFDEDGDSWPLRSCATAVALHRAQEMVRRKATRRSSHPSAARPLPRGYEP